MDPIRSKRILQAGLVSALLVSACSVAHAQDACSDERVKDFFVQGGEQVIEDSHLKITSLSQDEVVAQSTLTHLQVFDGAVGSQQEMGAVYLRRG
jgi:hypothetical protein